MDYDVRMMDGCWRILTCILIEYMEGKKFQFWESHLFLVKIVTVRIRKILISYVKLDHAFH